MKNKSDKAGLLEIAAAAVFSIFFLLFIGLILYGLHWAFFVVERGESCDQGNNYCDAQEEYWGR